MALIAYSIPDPGTNQQVPKGVRVVAWLAVAGGDRGAAYACPGATAKSVQVVGAGNQILTLQGSNKLDPGTGLTSTDWDTLASQTATGTFINVVTPSYYIRPARPTGTASASDVYVLIRTDARG